MKADDLLDELRGIAGSAAGGAQLDADVLERFGKAFLRLDLECLEGRPPAGWSFSKLSKSNG